MYCQKALLPAFCLLSSAALLLSPYVQATHSEVNIEQLSPSDSSRSSFFERQPHPFAVNWHWQDIYGQALSVNSEFAQDTVEHSLLDSYKVSFSLTYPIKAIHAFLSPRLEYAIQRINYYSDDHEPKITDLKSAFATTDESRTSQLFWQAYNQYQDDAFYHLKISPCVHPEHVERPCVRPNYSQLFYENRGHLKDIARQLSSQQPLLRAVKDAQHWVYRIPNKSEQQGNFLPPVSVLQSNVADSDEKALLLAALVSQLVPKYSLHLLYPSASVGSVSPVWLIIDSKSGVEGQKITLNNGQFTIISGSKSALDEMISSATKMTNESLY